MRETIRNKQCALHRDGGYTVNPDPPCAGPDVVANPGWNQRSSAHRCTRECRSKPAHPMDGRMNALRQAQGISRCAARCWAFRASAARREMEVRGVEPLCPGPSRTASTHIASVWISPRAARGRALRLRPAVVEDTAAGSRRPPPLFLLSTFPAPSRSQGGNVTALRRPLAFLRCCHLFFRRGINERPPTLDRQLRAPTKGRIRNTPEREK